MMAKLGRLSMQSLSFMTIFMVGMMFLSTATYAADHVPTVSIQSDAAGQKLMVDGEDFMINGMNWDYFPIGTNYSYSLWNQPDHIIEAALSREMSLLKGMGVNTIRMYTGVQPRWVK